LGPQALVFWRFAFAAPVLLAVFVASKGHLPARPSPVLVAAGAFFAIDLALWHSAIGFTTVANSTFIVATGNLCLGLTAWLVLKERPQKSWFVAFPLAIAGAFLLSQGGRGGLLGPEPLKLVGAVVAAPDWRGDLLAVGAALFASLYLLCSKVARARHDGLETIFWLSASGAAVAALVATASGEALLPAEPKYFAVPLALALLAQVLGQGLLVSGLGQLTGARVAAIFLLQPLTAAGLSVLVFGEVPGPVQIVGGAIMLLAIWHGGRAGRAQLVNTNPAG
jgi:drug/metabolite transporter (DMT)-like permease